jgi:hypothetical protein
MACLILQIYLNVFKRGKKEGSTLWGANLQYFLVLSLYHMLQTFILLLYSVCFYEHIRIGSVLINYKSTDGLSFKCIWRLFLLFSLMQILGLFNYAPNLNELPSSEKLTFHY